ncbi:MAG: hypothetical protein ACOYJY_04365 [Acutalibacteraceae bacterium]
MKKIIALTLAAAFALTLAACSNNSPANTSSGDATVSTAGTSSTTTTEAPATTTAAASTLTAEDLTQGYFLQINSFQQGVSGSSLVMARACCAVLRFAADHADALANGDLASETLLTCWEGMSEQDRKTFDTNFMTVTKQIDSCVEDWDSCAGLFEDSGVAEEMHTLLNDPAAMDAWRALCGRTLTMGNSSGE